MASSSGTLRRRRRTSRGREGESGESTLGGESSSAQKSASDALETEDIHIIGEEDDGVDYMEEEVGGEEGEEVGEKGSATALFQTPVAAASTRTTPTNHSRRSRSSAISSPATATAHATETGHRGLRGSRMDELSELNRAILLSLQDVSSSSSPGSINVSAQDISATNGKHRSC